MNQPLLQPNPSAPLAPPVVQHLTELYGLPGDRGARLAARRSFVLMKQSFMRAVETITVNSGEALRRKVRHADDPLDLWRLRRAVLSALAEDSPLRREIVQHLDTAFPDRLHNSGFMGM